MNKENVTTSISPPNTSMEILRKYFGQCFDKEGNFDINKFKEEVSQKDDINFSKESFSMEFLGKSYARLLATDEATTLLQEDTVWNEQEENKDSENLLIRGDNLEVLKHLSNAYQEQVKMIYIDPPYNTGSDGFVYEDDRQFDVKTLMELSGVDEERAKRILQFTRSKSNSHSAWLTFIYPRLYIAKQLLRDDGVIFISIDDNEVAQLRLLMDEIFGEENFVALVNKVTRKGGKTDSYIVSENDYVYIYSRNHISLPFEFGNIDTTSENYKFKDEYFEERGRFQTKPLDVSSLSYSKTMDYIVTDSEGNKYYPGGEERFNKRVGSKPSSKDWAWRWSKEKLEFALHNNFAYFKDGKIQTKIYEKKIISNNKPYRIVDKELSQKMGSLYLVDNSFSNFVSKKELDIYFTEKYFEHPKPTNLIKVLINLIPKNDNDIILDFFAGSGTTADAVMQLNAQDKKEGNRKFIRELRLIPSFSSCF